KQKKQELSKEDEFNIENPVVTSQKGRPLRRAKSTVELQDN
ncbi:4250_t:CDS:1, partial [Cetraspora pellucida]